jgi:hypothetical protein
MAYPEIQLDKESRIVVHNEDGSYRSSDTVEAIILTKILFELEKLSMTMKELNDKTR